MTLKRFQDLSIGDKFYGPAVLPIGKMAWRVAYTKTGIHCAEDQSGSTAIMPDSQMVEVIDKAS